MKLFRKSKLPKNLIFQNSNFIAITYWVAVPAGAGYDAYQLVTFTPQGDIIDEMRLGTSSGEIGTSWSFSATINDKFEIRIRDISTYDDEYEEGTKKVKKEFYEDKTYLITSNGKFKELTKTKSNRR